MSYRLEGVKALLAEASDDEVVGVGVDKVTLAAHGTVNGVLDAVGDDLDGLVADALDPVRLALDRGQLAGAGRGFLGGGVGGGGFAHGGWVGF